ncbi:MAG: penicillin-binding protein 2 [Bryobacteraceae bacterium]
MPLYTTSERDPERIPHPPPRLLRDEARFGTGKIAVFQYLTVAVFIFLVAGFWDLQVRNPDFYLERAAENYIRSVPVPAPRGKILDRDGRVIVDNHSSISVLLSRENLKYEHLRPIAQGLNLDYNALLDRMHRYELRPKYEPVVIKEELAPEDLAFVESHMDTNTFPEMSLFRAQRRLYPAEGMAAHVIGYVGEISESELDSPEYAGKYHLGDIVGKQGLEKQYNEILMGVDGQRRAEVDNTGRERKVLTDKPAVPGRTLQTTLDLDLQAVAELAMEDKKGAVVALDPRTGEVLAMVSHPSFDPSMFAGRIPARDWKELVENPGHPLLNRAIQAQQAPGSTFKPIMALAGLETGVIDDDFKVHCSGGASFYGNYFACHQKRGHGTLEVHRAIVQSCDVFFYTVGNKLGIDRIAQYADMVGYGHKTGIDLPNEASGIVPSTKWKMRTFRQKWYAGETISVSIGQGALTVTPLQMAVAIGGIATGGVWQQPHLVRDAKLDPAHRAELNLDNVQKVIYGMWGVVNEYGTGARARLANISLCGKTGTAQLASNKLLKGTRLGQTQTMKDNGWFVGFAPREAPEIVVATLWENGGEGPLASPIVRDVIKAYFDKKARLAGQQPEITASAESELLPMRRPAQP